MVRAYGTTSTWWTLPRRATPATPAALPRRRHAATPPRRHAAKPPRRHVVAAPPGTKEATHHHHHHPPTHPPLPHWQGHTAALKKLSSSPGCVTYNLGTGVGYSVLEMLKEYEKASGKQLQHKLADRRPGDIAVCYGDASLALKELGWKAELGLTEMCEDSWRWISNNPDGYN